MLIFFNPRNKSIKEQQLKVTIEDGRWKPSKYTNKDEMLEELLGGFIIKKIFTSKFNIGLEGGHILKQFV